MDDLKGLSSQEVAALTKQGKLNRINEKSGHSVPRIVASNVFTYFNAIFCLLAVLLIATGTFRNLTFLPVVVANTIIGIVQQLRAKRVLDKLALLDKSSYACIRDGAEQTVASDDLVLGDLIRLESGQQIPADAEVVQGAASANESLLTGESDEVEKVVGSELKSGSFIVSGACVARLTHVGADSYAAKLTSQAKAVHEEQSEMVHDIETIVRVAGILIIPVGAALYYLGIHQNGLSTTDAVSSMVGAVIGMIPEGLYLLVTIALALSASRLAQKQVLLHDMHSIETLARIDVLCTDKTGTITSDVMTVSDIFWPLSADDDDIERAQDILARYVRTVPDTNITMQAMRDYLPEAEGLEATEVTPFSSKLKYSEVACQDATYRLGAPEFLFDASQLAGSKILIDQCINRGQRVLALVEDTGDGARPLLFIALANEVRENAPDTFQGFAQQGVEVKVISGDNPLTVSRVAAQAGINGADRYIDASTLTTDERIAQAANYYTVFGRVKPEQKRKIVEAIQASGRKVAMTGDGVNDILAMKCADCSIAMGGGSDAARQAAQVVLLDSDFSHMHDIVSEGRRNINNITRSATLFLYKNIFSLLMALFSIFGAFAYPLSPTQVSLISMFNIGLPAFLLAFEPNEKKQEGHFISVVLKKAMPAALTSFCAISAMMIFADLFGISKTDVAVASTYLLSVVGILILINIIKPYNRYRLGVLFLCIVGFIAGAGFFYRLFDIRALSVQACVLCVLFGLAEVTVMQQMILFGEHARELVDMVLERE